MPFVPANEVFSLDRRNAFASGNNVSSPAGGAGGSSSMAGPQGLMPSALLGYIQYLNQLGANKSTQSRREHRSFTRTVQVPWAALRAGSQHLRASILTIRVNQCRRPVDSLNCCLASRVSPEGCDRISCECDSYRFCASHRRRIYRRP